MNWCVAQSLTSVGRRIAVTGTLGFAVFGFGCYLTGTAFNGMSTVFLLAAAEEFLFRVIAPAVISRGLVAWDTRINQVVSVMSAQVLFALCHFSPIGPIPALDLQVLMRFVLAGIFFSFLLEVRGLGVAIGVHASINREVMAGRSWDGSVCGFSIALAVLCLAMVVARRVQKSRGEAANLWQQWETPWSFEHMRAGVPVLWQSR